MLWKVQQIRWVWHEWLASITKSNYRKIVWIYCLGHAGVRGNERSDSLASRPHITGLHMEEIMRDINDMFRGWNCNWENSTVEVIELRNLIEKGTGLSDRRRGQAWLVVNQCATEETPSVGADVGAHTQTRNICNQKQTCQFSCLKLLIVFPKIGSSVGEIILPLPAFSFIFCCIREKTSPCISTEAALFGGLRLDLVLSCLVDVKCHVDVTLYVSIIINWLFFSLATQWEFFSKSVHTSLNGLVSMW